MTAFDKKTEKTHVPEKKEISSVAAGRLVAWKVCLAQSVLSRLRMKAARAPNNLWPPTLQGTEGVERSNVQSRPGARASAR